MASPEKQHRQRQYMKSKSKPVIMFDLFRVFYRYIDLDVDICANRGYYMYT